MTRWAVCLTAAAILAGCNPPEPPTPAEPAAPAPAASVSVAAPSPSKVEACDAPANLAREFIARKAKGYTEDDALAQLSREQLFELSYVVDGVYHAPADTPDSVIIGDVMATCRKIAETGSPY
jgi:hypothetical protein